MINCGVFKAIFIFLFIPSVIFAQASPCATEEHRQFDFWVGEWEVKNPDDQIVGNSIIQLILNDCVILENWKSVTPGYTGKSFNYYNRSSKKWNQKWIDSNGAPIEFEGVFNKENQALYYTATTTNRAGDEVMNKLTFFHLSNDHVRQLWQQSTDNGNNWITVFDGHYRRKK